MTIRDCANGETFNGNPVWFIIRLIKNIKEKRIKKIAWKL